MVLGGAVLAHLRNINAYHKPEACAKALGAVVNLSVDVTRNSRGALDMV
jgi:hypothetical protein